MNERNQRMTKNRNLKQRVRDRMAATGESYTVARDEVLKAAGTEPRARVSIDAPAGWRCRDTKWAAEMLRFELGSPSERRRNMARRLRGARRLHRLGEAVGQFVDVPKAELSVCELQEADLAVLVASRVGYLRGRTAYENFAVADASRDGYQVKTIRYSSDRPPVPWRVLEHVIRRADGGMAYLVGVGAEPAVFDERLIEVVAGSFSIND